MDLEARVRALEVIVQRIDFDLYNHGQDGLKTQFQEYVAEQKGREAERDKEHAANTLRLNVIIAILTFLVALLAAAPTIKALFKSSSEYLPDIFDTSHRIIRASTQNAEDH
jgi:hypothetical protein